MLISKTFWEVRFVDFIPLITAIVSPILIYWIYKKLDKYKEKAKLKAIFIRIKRMLENFLPEKKERSLSLGYILLILVTKLYMQKPIPTNPFWKRNMPLLVWLIP